MENLKLLSRIVMAIQNINNFDKQIQNILEDLGKFIDVSRIYIFLYGENDIKNTFEWSAEDTISQIDSLQSIKIQNAPSYKEMILKNGFICSDDTNDLPEDIVDILELQQIKSIVIYPLIISKEVKGFIRFDECRYERKWKSKELEILNAVSGIIANAYERMLFQQGVIDSEANFNNFFELIEDMFVVSDLDGNIRHCNRAFTEKLEYSILELKKKKIIELYPVDEREEISTIIKKMIDGEIEYCSREIKSKSGKIFLLETRIWISKWENQDCIYSISKDITKENESLKLFSKIFENNPLPIAIIGIDDKKFSNVNSAFIKKIGYFNDEIIGKTAKELNIFMDCEDLHHIINKVEDVSQIKNEEFIIRCKDGRLLNGLFSFEEISNEGKKSLLMVIVDITERVELIKNIEDKCEKLTNIIEGTNLGTWEWNIQTGKIEVNEQWAKMIGYSLEKISDNIHSYWRSFVHTEDLQVSSELLERHLNGETEYYDCEVRLKHKDGRWIWVQDRGKVTARDENGNPLKMFGTHSDITLKKDVEKELRESEKRFFLALDETKAGLWDYNMINNELFLSPMWKNILGYLEDEIENSVDAWVSLWHPEDKSIIKIAIDDYRKGKSKNYEVICRMKHKDGNWRWILTRGGILRDDNGTPRRWIGTNIDITKEREQSLELERFFTVNLDLLCITHIEGEFVKTNKAWEDILGYSSKKLKGRNFLEFIHPDDIDMTLKSMKQLGKGEKVTNFINRYINKDGKYHYIEWRANPYGDLVYAAARDVTERIKYENKILDISNKDALTGIYNRRYVFERANEMIREYKRIGKVFSLCILDIDFFKKINDNHGHQAGDFILKEFTKTIDENLRSHDILGRYGGEEFIVILNDADEKLSNTIIKRVLDIIREKTFIFNGSNIKFTFSGGISSCKEIGKEEITIDKLVEMADKRMYKGKNTGRNKIVFKD